MVEEKKIHLLKRPSWTKKSQMVFVTLRSGWDGQSNFFFGRLPLSVYIYFLKICVNIS